MRYKTYKILSYIFTPLVKIYLFFRLLRGKEDKKRFRERLGFYKVSRPTGILVWIHAASVGEINSVILFIEELKKRFSNINILLTSGTVTSAHLIEKRGIKGIIHQFIPVDTPDATIRFLRHWRPDIGFWVESELWPNLVVTARARSCFMVIINGRMSLDSFHKWQKYGLLTAFDMLSSFELVFAQSEDDAQRFRALGARKTLCVGNLKYDSAALPCNEADLFSLQQQINSRPVWLAASTHHNEEEQIIETHKILAKSYPDILTIIAPRHPHRGEEIAGVLTKHASVALRSKKNAITEKTGFYIADTLGEMGVFYRLCEIVFMGGSLVPHGGQNPIEPARLRCCVLTGVHTENFVEVYDEMEKLSICLRVENAVKLAEKINYLLKNSDEIIKIQAKSKEWLEKKSGAATKIINLLTPIFTVGKENKS